MASTAPASGTANAPPAAVARHTVSWAAVLGVSLAVAACGGTNDASFPSPDLGAGDGSGAHAGGTGAQPCGTGKAADGPIQLAAAKSPSALAVAGTSVYWIDSSLGTVNVVSACGGAPTTLVTTSTLGSSTLIPAGLAVAGGEVYFTTQDPWNPDDDGGAVWKVPSAGGAPTMLVQGLDRPGPIAVTGASIVWIDSWDTHSDDGQIEQTALDGSSRVILASAQNGPMGLALGGGRVVWTNAGYVDSERGSIIETPMGGGAADGIAAGQEMPVSIAVAGPDAFWANEGDPNVPNSGSIMKVHLDPNTPEDPVTLVAGGAPNVIAVDGAHAYWADAQKVYEVPLAGGTPTTVASDQIGVLAIAVDDTSVYWTTTAAGTRQGSIMKIAK